MSTANSVLALLHALAVMHCGTTVNYLITHFFQRVPVLLTKCISLFKGTVSDVLFSLTNMQLHPIPPAKFSNSVLVISVINYL